MSHQPDQRLTPAEVAAMFRVHPRTVTRWAKAGRLTSVRTLGGHRRYSEVEVRALLRGERPVPVPAPRHSVGVETVTTELRRLGAPDGAGLAVVERAHGRPVKVCATDIGYHGSNFEDLARSYARTYRATYIPAVRA